MDVGQILFGLKGAGLIFQGDVVKDLETDVGIMLMETSIRK